VDFYTLYGRKLSFRIVFYNKALICPFRLSRGTYECAHHNTPEFEPNHVSNDLATPLAISRGGCYTSGSVLMLQDSRKPASILLSDLTIDIDGLYSDISPILRTYIDGLVLVPQQYLTSHCAGFGRLSLEALRCW
jgi:hypothetical protein